MRNDLISKKTLIETSKNPLTFEEKLEITMDNFLTVIDTSPIINNVELPCNIGDTVYNIVPMASEKNKYREDIVSEIRICSDSILICFKNGLAKDAKQIGKTLFLTQEEVEREIERAAKIL